MASNKTDKLLEEARKKNAAKLELDNLLGEINGTAPEVPATAPAPEPVAPEPVAPEPLTPEEVKPLFTTTIEDAPAPLINEAPAVVEPINTVKVAEAPEPAPEPAPEAEAPKAAIGIPGQPRVTRAMTRRDAELAAGAKALERHRKPGE